MEKNVEKYIVSRKVARKILEKCNGKFFGITYITKNSKKIANVNGRLGVKKHLKGGKTTTKEDLITGYDVKAEKYRKIYLDEVVEIRADKKVFIF